MTDVPPEAPGHSRGTARLSVHNPDPDDGLFDVVCPACGDDPPGLLGGPWPHAVARAKLEYHCGMNTAGVQAGLHLL